MNGEFNLGPLLSGLIASAPLWVLIVFGAYAMGRGKQFSIADLLILIAVEAIAIAIALPSFYFARE